MFELNILLDIQWPLDLNWIFLGKTPLGILLQRPLWVYQTRDRQGLGPQHLHLHSSPDMSVG